MKILVVTDMQTPQKMFGEQDHAEGPLVIHAYFPMDYTEIKQERVSYTNCYLLDCENTILVSVLAA